MKVKLFLLTLLVIFPGIALASQSGVVVRHSDGSVKKSCVSYSEEQISSLELLQRAGMSPVSDRGFIVEIDGEKAKSAWDSGAKDNYWSFWRLGNGSWLYSRGGASASSVKDGIADGWQIGGSELVLPVVNFSDICKQQQSNETAPAAQTQEAVADTQTQSAQRKTAVANTNKDSTQSVVVSPTPESSVSVRAFVEGEEVVKKKSISPYIIAFLFLIGIAIPFLLRKRLA